MSVRKPRKKNSFVPATDNDLQIYLEWCLKHNIFNDMWSRRHNDEHFFFVYDLEAPGPMTGSVIDTACEISVHTTASNEIKLAHAKGLRGFTTLLLPDVAGAIGLIGRRMPVLHLPSTMCIGTFTSDYRQLRPSHTLLSAVSGSDTWNICVPTLPSTSDNTWTVARDVYVSRN